MEQSQLQTTSDGEESSDDGLDDATIELPNKQSRKWTLSQG